MLFASLQIDAFQHMQHFVQGVQQQAQHAVAAEDHQRKQELYKLMARSDLFLETQQHRRIAKQIQAFLENMSQEEV